MSITTVTSNGYKTEVLSPRPPSPAFGSPLRRDAALDEEEDEMRLAMGADELDDEEDEPIVMAVSRRKRASKDRESDMDRYVEESGKKEKEKRRSRDTEAEPGPSSYEGKKPKLKDVTNAPPPRPSLATIDSHGRQITNLYIEGY